MSTYLVTSEAGTTALIQTAASQTFILDGAGQGPAGVGVPSGGTTGQVLSKNSGTNYDTEWSTAADLVPYKQAKVSIVVGAHGDSGYITDGTDDQVQINQALEDASDAGGGTVWIPDASYSISNTIIPKSNVYLRGSGMYVTHLFGVSTLTTAVINTHADPADLAALLSGDFSNVLTDFMISDFTIDGSAVQFTGNGFVDVYRKGMQVQNSLRFRCQNIRVQNTVATGFGNDFQEQALYDNCIAYNCGREAFDPGFNGFGFGHGKENESIVLTNCIAINCGNNGFLLEKQFTSVFFAYPRDFLLSNCYSVGCRRGFKISAANGVSLVNCKALNCVRTGFEIESRGFVSVPYDFTAVGIEAYGNGSAGILFNSDSRNGNVLLDGVRSFSNGGNGISIAGTRAELNNINCHDNDSSGIYISPSDFIMFQTTVDAIKLSNINCFNNGQDDPDDNCHGIYVRGNDIPIDSISLTNVSCFDNQDIPTQLIGAFVEGRVSKVLLNGLEAYGHAWNGVYINIEEVVVNDYQLSEIKAYNNSRSSTVSPHSSGIYIAATSASNAALDGLTIQDIHAYDDQEDIVPRKADISIYSVPTEVSGNLNGNYTYKVTFVNAVGETQGSPASVLISPVNKQVKITTLPLGPSGTTARKIYRTVAGGTQHKLVDTVSNNTTTTYTDNIADGSLGANVPTVNTDGTTNVPFAPVTTIYNPSIPPTGNLTGTYRYKVTYVSALGETAGGYTSTVSGLSSNQVLVYVPTGPPGTTARKLYRTAGGGADGTQKLVTTLTGNDPTVTDYSKYIDNIADGSLGAAVPTTSNAFVATQEYGLSLQGVITNALVIDNDVRNNATAGMDISSSVSSNLTNVFINNKGWNSEESYSLGNITGSITINRLNGQTQYGTLTGNITPTITAGKNDGDRLIMVLTQDATGSRTVTWPSNLVGGPVLSTAASAVDVIPAVWDSSSSKWRKLPGFNNPMTTAGDIMYGATSGFPTRLAAGTNTQLLHGGSTPSWSAIALAADVSGTLPVANGGSGAATLTGILKGNGTSAFTAVTAPSGALVGDTDTQTLTNKRVTKRIGTTASSATPTPDADANDQYNVTALATGATFGAPTGTPTNGQHLIIRIKDNGSAQSLAYNAAYRAVGVTLPTTTVISKTIYLGCIYNSADSTWDVVAAAQEA